MASPVIIAKMAELENPKIRLRKVRRVLIQVMALNLLVAGAKIAVGFITNTLSMLADGFHSVIDSTSNVVGLVGVTAAARPPDKDHPYGHHKYETIASLAIGALVLFTAVQIIQEAMQRLSGHNIPKIGYLNVLVMLGTMAINIWVSTYEARAGKRLKSEILSADSLQTRSDIFVSAGVLAAMALIWLGYPRLDPVAALCVTAAILYSAWIIFSRSTQTLSDRTVLQAKDIEDAALGVDGVQSVEKVRSRGTRQRIAVDLHIRVDPNISVTLAHKITHDVKRAVQESTGAHDVIIHTEPGADQVGSGPPSS